MSADNRFQFNVPIDIIKSDENGWRIRGLASTEDKDLQNEIVRQSGLDISMLKAGRGLINYEHQNDPENLIGAIDNADITERGLEFEGYLFKKHKRAQAVAEIMQSLDNKHQKRVQLSIEGQVRKSDKRKINGGVDVRRAFVDRVAVTFEPVNPKTYLEFAKSLTAATPDELDDVITTPGSDPKELVVTESLVKAIDEIELAKTMTAAGADAAPATLCGGAAISTESVDGDVKEMATPTKKKKKFKDVDIKVKKSLIRNLFIKMATDNPDVKLEFIKSAITEIVRNRMIQEQE